MTDRKPAASSLTVRLPADLHAAFMAACFEADVTAAQVVRAACREFVTGNAQGSLPFVGSKGKRGK